MTHKWRHTRYTKDHNFAIGFLLRNTTPAKNIESNCLSNDPICFFPERIFSSKRGLKFDWERSHAPNSKSLDEEPVTGLFSSSNLETACKCVGQKLSITKFVTLFFPPKKKANSSSRVKFYLNSECKSGLLWGESLHLVEWAELKSY